MASEELRDLADRQQRALAARDLAMLRALQTEYAAISKRITKEISALEDKIAAAQLAGEPVNTSWLYQTGRLAKLKDEVIAAMGEYNAQANAIINGAQNAAVAQAQIDAQAQLAASMGTPPDPNIAPAWASLPREAISGLVGRMQDNGSPISAALARYGEETAARMGSELLAGMALGRNPRAVARSLERIAGGANYKYLRLARTEMLNSYRGASLATYRQSSRVMDGVWEWATAQDERVCDFCRSRDGVKYPLDTPFDTHPNCRCTPLPVTKSWADLFPGVDFGSGAASGTGAQTSSPNTPLGTPVSDALAWAKGKYAAGHKRVVDAINRVHGDGALPATPIQMSRAKSEHGSYRQWSNIYGHIVKSEIHITGTSPHREFTLAHEIGHFLDYEGINNTAQAPAGKSAFAANAPETAPVRYALAQSSQIKSIADLKSNTGGVPITGADGRTYTYRPDRAYVNYLLDPREQMARSYSQYIAVRSQDPVLLKQLDDIRNEPLHGLYPTQWADADFEPIAQAYDEMFVNIGWQEKGNP